MGGIALIILPNPKNFKYILYFLPPFGNFCAKGRQTGRMETMKQKYTLNIADLQISVISDAPPEEVAKIGGILDRKMREIYLKSRCPKTDAALLCALEAVADRLCLTDRAAELEDKCAKYGVVLDSLKDRNAELMAELDRLRSENEVLRSLLTPDSIPAVPQPISPAEFFSRVADAQSEEAPAPEPAATPDEEPKRPSRVGSMFEQLSFGDVD